MNNITDLLAEIRELSGRENDPRLTDAVLLRWINRYKRELQRNRRYRFSHNSTQIVATQNDRSTDLPSDFMQMIAIRRQRARLVANSFDAHGNQIQIIKETILHQHVNKEAFLDQFPILRNDLEPYVGTPNDYIIQGSSIMWGPIPSENESLFIDYYRFFPEYDDANITTDDFITYYYDGLLAFGMVEMFRSWIENEKKLREWEKALNKAEKGLRLHQIAVEHPIETDINLPDL